MALLVFALAVTPVAALADAVVGADRSQRIADANAVLAGKAGQTIVMKDANDIRVRLARHTHAILIAAKVIAEPAFAFGAGLALALFDASVAFVVAYTVGRLKSTVCVAFAFPVVIFVAVASGGVLV